MRKLDLLRFFLLVAGAGALPAHPASAVSTLTGPGAITPYFAGADSFPQLDLSGPELVDIGTGFEVYAGTAGAPSNAFQLDVDFLDSHPPDRYEDLILTAALKPNVDYAGVSVRLTFAQDVVQLDFDHGDFTNASLFGIPELSNLPGTGYGTGGFMSLENARMGGFDLQTDLTRGVNDPLAFTVEVFGVTSPEQLIRFDVFGLCEYGVVFGNNPNAGAAGFQVGPVRPVPEPGAVALYLAGFGVAAVALRRRLAS